MKRSLSHIVCGIAVFVAAFTLIGRAATVDDIVQNELTQKGILLGYNERRGEIVAVGKNVIKIDDVASYPLLAALRDRCYKIASLEARGKILQVLKHSLTAGRRVDFQHDGISASLNLASISQAFSERVLTGWRIVASAEECSKGFYAVAVAVLWSNESEEKLESAKVGKIAPADGWKEELLAYIKGQDLSSWVDVRVFIDSDGFPHVMGIGLADWDGDSRTQRAAMSKADMIAQKNLMLGLFGDAAIMEAAGKWRTESFSGSDCEVAQLKFYGALAEVRVRETLPEGCSPFHFAVIENPLNRQKEFVSIYSFEPNGVSGHGRVVLGNKVSCGVTDVEPKQGVKIWNPNTGKFEAVKE